MHSDSTYSDLEKQYRNGSESWGDDEELTNQIVAYVNTVPHESILEVGPGRGYLLRKLTELSPKVTAIDVSATALKSAKEHAPEAQMIESSFEDLPVNTTYDVIICSEVLYYMKNRKQIIEKLQQSGQYLITSHYIFSGLNIGFGSIFYELYLRKFSLLKFRTKFSHNPFGVELISLWKLNST